MMSREAMQKALEALEEANQTMSMEYSQENYYLEQITALRLALYGEAPMKPKFLKILETAVLSGVCLGHNRAYKHNDTPERYEINRSICNEVMNEIHEWFDFGGGKS